MAKQFQIALILVFVIIVTIVAYDPATCEFDLPIDEPSKGYEQTPNCTIIERNGGPLYDRMLTESRQFRDLLDAIWKYDEKFGTHRMAVFRNELYRKHDMTHCGQAAGESGQVEWLDCVIGLRVIMIAEIRNHLLDD